MILGKAFLKEGKAIAKIMPVLINHTRFLGFLVTIARLQCQKRRQNKLRILQMLFSARINVFHTCK